MGQDLPDDLRGNYDAALELSERPEMHGALARVAREPVLVEKAGGDAAALLGDLGVDVPGGLSVFVTRDGMPVPGEWWPFQIVLSNCRTFYRFDPVKKRVVETEAVCFTFTIVPTPIPGGPWG